MARLPEFITFTGADDFTNVRAMSALSRRYPIEWGILFSPTRQNVDLRYPCGEAQSRFLWSGLRMSAHLCGGYARGIMDGDPFHGPVDLGHFRRIQVNHYAPVPSRIISFRNGWGRMRCIAQTRADAFPADTSVDWLCDASGGRGLVRTSWPRHPGGARLVGYAGGLTPANVMDAIVTIDARGPYWIDMESGVRTDNVFDLTLCEQVCEAVYSSAPTTDRQEG